MNNPPFQGVADNLAGYGRYGDSQLVHMNPVEVQGIASLVPGGKLTTNPVTGQPEAFLPFLIPLLSQLAPAAFTAAGSALGTGGIMGAIGSGLTYLGSNAALGSAVASGAIEAARTGDLKKGLVSGITSFGIGKALGGASDALSPDVGPAAENVSAVGDQIASGTNAIQQATTTLGGLTEGTPEYAKAAENLANLQNAQNVMTQTNLNPFETGLGMTPQEAAQQGLSDARLAARQDAFSSFKESPMEFTKEFGSNLMKPGSMVPIAIGEGQRTQMEADEELERRNAMNKENKRKDYLRSLGIMDEAYGRLSQDYPGYMNTGGIVSLNPDDYMQRRDGFNNIGNPVRMAKGGSSSSKEEEGAAELMGLDVDRGSLLSRIYGGLKDAAIDTGSYMADKFAGGLGTLRDVGSAAISGEGGFGGLDNPDVRGAAPLPVTNTFAANTSADRIGEAGMADLNFKNYSSPGGLSQLRTLLQGGDEEFTHNFGPGSAADRQANIRGSQVIAPQELAQLGRPGFGPEIQYFRNPGDPAPTPPPGGETPGPGGPGKGRNAESDQFMNDLLSRRNTPPPASTSPAAPAADAQPIASTPPGSIEDIVADIQAPDLADLQLRRGRPAQPVDPMEMIEQEAIPDITVSEDSMEAAVVPPIPDSVAEKAIVPADPNMPFMGAGMMGEDIAGIAELLAQRQGRPSRGRRFMLGGGDTNVSPPVDPAQMPVGPAQQAADPAQVLIEQTIMAVLGQLPEEQAEVVINQFINEFGEEAFQMLRNQTLNAVVPGAQTEGMIEGEGGGMDDLVPGMIGNQQKVAVSPGEYIVSADVVSGLGDGSSDAGADKLDAMMDDVRVAKTGGTIQPGPINHRVIPA